jgi:hypothetical protein
MGKTPEHNATNKELSRWSLGVIASTLLAAATIITYFSGLWNTAVAAGLPKEDAAFVTQRQLTAVVQKMDQLDAGTAKKEDVQDVKQQMSRVEGKLDRLIEIQLRQKTGGGK